jgi:hypothetical protein
MRMSAASLSPIDEGLKRGTVQPLAPSRRSRFVVAKWSGLEAPMWRPPRDRRHSAATPAASPRNHTGGHRYVPCSSVGRAALGGEEAR